MPTVTNYTVVRDGTAHAIITVPPEQLKNTRVRVDLSGPEFENIYALTVNLPAQDIDRNCIVVLTAPRFTVQIPVQAFNLGVVRALSRLEREQASVTITVAEVRGEEITFLKTQLPGDPKPVTPIYQLSARLFDGGQQSELELMAEPIIVISHLHTDRMILGHCNLYLFDPGTQVWVFGGYYNECSKDMYFHRPGFWQLLSQ